VNERGGRRSGEERRGRRRESNVRLSRSPSLIRVNRRGDRVERGAGLFLCAWRVDDDRRVEGCLDRATAADLVIGGKRAPAKRERPTIPTNQQHRNTLQSHRLQTNPHLSANTLERDLAPAKNSVQLRVIASNEAPSAKQRHSSRAASNSLQRGAFTTSRGEKERAVPRPCPGTKERARILRNAFR